MVTIEIVSGMVCVYVYIYIYKFSPRGFSEPVYKYIQGQTVEGLRKSARAAHILRRNLQPIRSALGKRNRDKPQHYPTLCEKCVGSFKSLNRRIERLDHGLTSLSEKARRSNHLQILEQRQHLLLNRPFAVRSHVTTP